MTSRRRLFAAVALGTFLLVQVFAFVWPATYEARAAVMIQKSRYTPRLDSPARTESPVLVAEITEEEVNSEIAVLTSHRVLSATVEATGLAKARPSWFWRLLFAPLRAYERAHAAYHEVPPPTDADRAIRALSGALGVERLKESRILVITYQTRDPRVGEAVLAELLRNYVAHHVEVHGAQQVVPFFSSQTEVLARELARHEDALQAIKKRVRAVDMPTEREVQLKLDAGLREENEMLGRRLVELDGKIAAFDRVLERTSRGEADAAASPASQPALDEFKVQALRLQLEQIRFEGRYQDDAPPVLENRKKLEAARQALDEERQNVSKHGPTVVALHEERERAVADRAGIVERRQALEKQLGASRARLVELDEGSVAASRAQRLIRSAEDRYMMVLSQQERALIDSALDSGKFTNVSVVQEAAASAKPVRPKKLIVLLASVFGGLLLGFAACLVQEVRTTGLAPLLAAAVTEP
ncbi:MAG: GNVR domain-containing protein [Thermoanaerobaculia bacterium]|nr:GNVR domain-containing protein [Thermoanaerobaculia bacterium]